MCVFEQVNLSVFEQVNLYILVAGLEALCVQCDEKFKRCYLQVFTQKSMLYWVSMVQVQIESVGKVTIRTGWSPKVVC